MEQDINWEMKTVEERLDYYADVKIFHPFLKEKVIETVSAIKRARGERLVIVHGPSGVGKKELIARVIESLAKEQRFSRESIGTIPIVYTEASATNSNNFDWNVLFESILEELNEPMMNKKIRFEQGVAFNPAGDIVYKTNIKPAKLQKVVEKALKHRQVKVLIINEAQHTMKIAGSKRLNQQLDIIKSLVNLSGTCHVLIGTYELLSYLDELENPAQLNNRATGIDFPRYRLDVKEERLIFIKLLRQYLSKMPFSNPPVELAEDWQYFYKHSLGCAGTLKLWLSNALGVALEEGADNLTREHLDRTKIPGERCANMELEIRAGEKKLAEARSEAKLDELLNLNKKSTTEQKAGKSQKSKGSLPGMRNPIRDDSWEGVEQTESNIS